MRKPLSLKNAIRVNSLAVGRPQDVDLDHRRFLGVDLHIQFQGIALDAIEDHFLVSWQNRLADVLVIASERFDVAGGFDV